MEKDELAPMEPLAGYAPPVDPEVKAFRFGALSNTGRWEFVADVVEALRGRQVAGCAVVALDNGNTVIRIELEKED